MKLQESRHVEVAHDVAIDHQERLVNLGDGGGVTNRARGVEGFGFDGVGHAHASDHVRGVGLNKSIGQVTPRTGRRR